jgi:hypothetical protein
VGGYAAAPYGAPQAPPSGPAGDPQQASYGVYQSSVYGAAPAPPYGGYDAAGSPGVGPPGYGAAPPYGGPGYGPPPYGSSPYGGPPGQYGYAPQTAGTNGLAVASLVLGIVWIFWLGSLLAIIFGAVALRQIKSSGSTEAGKGLAIAGLTLGLVGAATFIWFIAFASTVSCVNGICSH